MGEDVVVEEETAAILLLRLPRTTKANPSSAMIRLALPRLCHQMIYPPQHHKNNTTRNNEKTTTKRKTRSNRTKSKKLKNQTKTCLSKSDLDTLRWIAKWSASVMRGENPPRPE